MATKETKSIIPWLEGKLDFNAIISKVKWLFQKPKKDSWKTAPKRQTKAFMLTRKDGLISVWVAAIVVIYVVVYWFIVKWKYDDMNSKADELYNLATYNAVLDDSTVGLLDLYIEWTTPTTIWNMVEINDNVEETLKNREEFKKQQKSYYEVLLQNIYLPSLNVWKDPYTKDFDMSVLWQKYLEADKFQDLYLIQYWSDFIKHVSDDAEYNTIDSIVIWDMVELSDSNYFYTPISVSFSSPDKRSFLLLVNKLSMTSNSNNIALVNEFFFYLLMNIKEDKSDVIEQLMEEYRPMFSSSSNREGPASIAEMTEEQLSDYKDKVIGYNLYQWINYTGTGDNTNLLIDDKLIVETIRENVLCNRDTSNAECFYKFRDKYRNLPYLAYKIWLEHQENRTEGLFSFLKDLPSVIAITSFGFEKYSTSSFLNNDTEQYEWSLTFNAFGRGISTDELEEAATVLWNLCLWKTSNQVMSPDIALTRVNDTIASLWWEDKNINISSLWELQWLFTVIQEQYNWLSNYNKMIKLFELWRMLNDANLCNM